MNRDQAIRLNEIQHRALKRIVELRRLRLEGIRDTNVEYSGPGRAEPLDVEIDAEIALIKAELDLETFEVQLEEFHK